MGETGKYQMSDVMLSSEIKQPKAMGTVLPSIFMALAGLLRNVVLARQIATQRGWQRY